MYTFIAKISFCQKRKLFILIISVVLTTFPAYILKVMISILFLFHLQKAERMALNSSQSRQLYEVNSTKKQLALLAHFQINFIYINHLLLILQFSILLSTVLLWNSNAFINWRNVIAVIVYYKMSPNYTK